MTRVGSRRLLRFAQCFAAQIVPMLEGLNGIGHQRMLGRARVLVGGRNGLESDSSRLRSIHNCPCRVLISSVVHYKSDMHLGYFNFMMIMERFGVRSKPFFSLFVLQHTMFLLP
jgi:hypothetical protein